MRIASLFYVFETVFQFCEFDDFFVCACISSFIICNERPMDNYKLIFWTGYVQLFKGIVLDTWPTRYNVRAVRVMQN